LLNPSTHTHIHAHTNARVSLFAHVTKGKWKKNGRKTEQNGYTFGIYFGKIKN